MRRPWFIAAAAAATALLAPAVLAQSGAQSHFDALNTFSEEIPGACTDQCQDFQTNLGNCMSAPDFDSCICAQDVTNAASTCMNCAISYNSQNNADPSDAQNALNSINQCAGGTASSSSSSSSSAAPTSSSSAASSSAAGPVPQASSPASNWHVSGTTFSGSITSSLIRGSSYFGSSIPSSSQITSTGSDGSVVTTRSSYVPPTGPGGAVAGSPFPSQTVSRNAFSAASISTAPVAAFFLCVLAGAALL